MAGRSKIYLDYAAATPLDPRVLKAMEPYFSADFYNPSATYMAGAAVRSALEGARVGVAYWLGSRPAEIIFTAGGTEANNLAIRGVMERFPKANVVVSAIEHDSVLDPARLYKHKEAKVAPDGRLDPEKLAESIDDDTVLVSVGYANNEIGTVQPLREIGRMIENIRADRRRRGVKNPLYLHTDACQAGNHLDLHAARLGVDMMTLNGGKIYGPKQSGVLYVKAGTELKPMITGGGQERGLRSGTENVPAAIGFSAALEIAQSSRRDETVRIRRLQTLFLDRLRSAVPGAVVNGSLKHRLPNNVHVTIPGQDNERLLIQLDEAGIMAAAGSACSASREEPSHVLGAIGMTDSDARSSLRFTMGRDTTEAMVRKTVRTLADLLS